MGNMGEGGGVRGLIAVVLVAGFGGCGEEDGQGTGPVCTPGAEQACYDGPARTEGVGVCAAGRQSCIARGNGWGPCSDAVTPGEEDCATAEDEDCDGQTPPCAPGPVIDIRADVNRNGSIDFDDPSEDDGEGSWDWSHGAIFLANLDDDEQACPVTGSDGQLAACHDAADEQLNGASDEDDLARLETAPWPEAPDDASGTITVQSPGADWVRLFIRDGSSFVRYEPGALLSAAELRAGVQLGIEGRDVVRDAAEWDGVVDVSFEVDPGTGPDGPWPVGSDTVRLQVAPVIFRHQLHEAEAIYATELGGWPSSEAFLDDLELAVTAAGVAEGLVRFDDVDDQWTQDWFETAYMSMPAADGAQVIHVNLRSANHQNGNLRQAGRVVFTHLRGPGVAGLVQFDPAHPDEMDSLNGLGNLETIPPFEHQGLSWPLGRVLQGSTPTRYPDPSVDLLVSSQGVQEPLTIDTEWLFAGHVDETVSFVAADNARGWIMLVADPALARSMLEAECDVGDPGSTPGCASELFVGMWWNLATPADVPIYDVLTDPDVMNTSAWAAVEIDEQVQILQQATGLGAAEMVPVPFLLHPIDGLAVAYQPSPINSLVLSPEHLAAPRTHGPLINGTDIFQAQLEAALGAQGITVHWVEDWDLYHRAGGEVHCGTNARRQVPTDERWWEGGS